MNAVAAGYYHTCALKDGGVKCWGYARYFNGSLLTLLPRPTWIQGWGPGSNVTSLCVGLAHNCVVRLGKAYCWGENSEGQTSQPTATTLVANPQNVSGLPEDAVKVSCGRSHTCVLLLSGRAMCWGANTFGQLGTGNASTQAPFSLTTPQAVFNFTDIADIVAGAQATCVKRVAVNSTITTWCWGKNIDRQLGAGSLASFSAEALRVDPDYPGGVEMMAAGNDAFCGISSQNGSAYCVGFGALGELGNGDTNGRAQLTAVSILGLNRVQHISASLVSARTCAVLDNGEAWCWGTFIAASVNPCCIGNGSSNVTALVPQRVDENGLKDFVQIAVGRSVACGLRGTNSEVWCWGDNQYGALGNGAVGGPLAVLPRPVVMGDE